MIYDIHWLKENEESIFRGYKVEYLSFKEGDFGDLERVDFIGDLMGGSIDFWSSGWLGLYLYDYNKEKVILNILLETDQIIEKEKYINELKSCLQQQS